VEGLNNKLKVLKRRCYGLRNVGRLFQRPTLDLDGYRRFSPWAAAAHEIWAPPRLFAKSPAALRDTAPSRTTVAGRIGHRCPDSPPYVSRTPRIGSPNSTWRAIVDANAV